MTLSGKMTKWHERSLWIRVAVVPLLLGGGFYWGFGHIPGGPNNPQPGLRFAALALGPIVGATMLGFGFWINRQRVKEFECDETSFRFRKLGAAQTETRDLSEIVKVEDMRMGYWVGFRDGSEPRSRLT
jgi:hypothetical protein